MKKITAKRKIKMLISIFSFIGLFSVATRYSATETINGVIVKASGLVFGMFFLWMFGTMLLFTDDSVKIEWGRKFWGVFKR